MMYNAKSSVAQEFINHEEILSTIEYAKKNKNNYEMILDILQEAEQMNGISHKQAAVLLECDDEEILAKIYNLAGRIKDRIYGKRIVMFAPLYLSNYCVNGCTYCPYHAKNTDRDWKSVV